MAVLEGVEYPAAKRQRLEKDDLVAKRSGSRLFAPFRTVGLVSPTSIPFTSVPLGTTTFQITTSVGRSLQTYDLRRGLNLVFLSRPQCPEIITATCAYRDRVFAAWGGTRTGSPHGVWIIKRGRVIAELEVDETIDQEIKKILVFGIWIVACGTKAIEVWRSETYEHYTTILAPTANTTNEKLGFTGDICTLPTFLNKLFVGNHDGSVGIYNLSTGKQVHVLSPPRSSSGSITALSPAPALSLLAIAFADGSVIILDVVSEQTVMQLRQSTSAQYVSSITFRTDGAGAGEDGRQDGIMATSSLSGGDITFWDLNRGGKIVGVLRGAHEVTSASQASGINKVEFLPGQPILVSSGLDNALRSWIFDQTPFSSIPRLLHSRSGHAAPISNLRFLPAASDGSEAASKWLLSAGQDRSLWGFSLRKDGQSSELSQGSVKHKAKKVGGLSETASSVEDFKAPPITAIACSLNRDGGMGAVGGPVWTNPKASNAEEANMTGWESVVTAHEGDRFARTWFWGRKKAGRWAFESGDRKPVTSVAITSCGTFALVGSAAGSLDMFNLQSGLHRQRFPPRLKPSQVKQVRTQQLESGKAVHIQRGHSDAITGIIVDNLNQTIISSSLDNTVIFWDFSTGNVLHKMTFDAGSPTAIRYNPVSGLISIACDDCCIRVVDIEVRRTVRELWGCVGQIYDHCFSHDGRWIVASSMDSVVRIFDLATGHMIDAFKTATCTSVAFSSTGEFLATAHAGGIGINIWNNKSLFMRIPTQQIDEDQGVIDLTNSAEFEAVSQLTLEDDVLDINGIGQDDSRSTFEQLDQGLLTLSLTPSSRWQTLLNLDTIRERNKPIQPPEKPKAAPFFLGSTLANGTSQIPGEQSAPAQLQLPLPNSLDDERSRVSRLSNMAPAATTISRLLSKFSCTGMSDLDPLISHLTNLAPSAADLEIRSLMLDEMVPFVDALSARLRQRRDFELVNTWMSVFLRIHAEFVSEVEDIRQAVLSFKATMSKEEERLSALVGWSHGVIDFLRSSR